jgi:hypothetical protein
MRTKAEHVPELFAASDRTSLSDKSRSGKVEEVNPSCGEKARKERLSVFGKNQTIQKTWLAPNGFSLAQLIWCADRRIWLVVVRGRVVFESESCLFENDIVWSENSTYFGIHIHTNDDLYQGAYILISDGIKTETCEIPKGMFLREFLIDCHGELAAWILDDGEQCSPQIYERRFENFSMAWDLQWSRFGSVSFKAVDGNEVLSITDETEVVSH